MDLKIPTSRRAEACQQGGSRPDLSMVADNPTWGAPRVHGELLKLGFDLSERSVSRWMRRAPRGADPVKQWLAFLRNHREAIVGIELGRADVKVKGYQSHPFGCEMGSQFHQHHVSRGPPIIPDGRVSQVRFGILAFLHGSFQLSEV